MSFSFTSSRDTSDYSRFFKTEASSSVGSTQRGPGLASRQATQASIRKGNVNANKTRASTQAEYDRYPTRREENESNSEGLSSQMQLEKLKLQIQLETQVKEETSDTSEIPTPNENFAALAEKLAKSVNDTTFVGAVDALAKKYNKTPADIYSIINHESVWDPTVINEGGYSGLFQIGEEAAGEAGIDYASISTMTPTQQVAAYDKYLKRWNYDGSVSLGLMQAAPGLASRLKGSPPTTVVYTVGSDEWNANPKWRSGAESDGPVTIASLDNFYDN